MNQPMKITAKEFYELDRSFFAAVSDPNRNFMRMRSDAVCQFQLTVGGITSALVLVQSQNY